jgi:dTMP kinase
VSRRRGCFITFEGGEGTGKSTQVQRAFIYLKKKRKKVIVVREPGSTKIGEAIRKLLLHPSNQKMSVETEFFLYLAARSQLVDEVIVKALQKGWFVICDRFEDSTVAYQGYAGKLPVSMVSRVAPAARGKLVPDLTFLLDIDPKKGLKRSGRKDRMERKSLSYHQAIRRGYLKIARKNKKRIILISTNTSKEVVQNKIRKVLHRVLA